MRERLEGPCPPEQKPSDHQLTALHFVLLLLMNLFVDFAIFGPFQHRLRRKLALAGLVPTGPGTFRKVEIKGPPDLESWLLCFRVLRAALIMLKAVGVAALDRHVEKIMKLARDWEQDLDLALPGRGAHEIGRDANDAP